MRENLQTVIALAAAEDHVARYCGGSHISEDGQIAPTAFHLRSAEEYLSVRKVFDLKKRLWQLEDRTQWPKRDRDEYRRIMEELKQEERKLKKGG